MRLNVGFEPTEGLLILKLDLIIDFLILAIIIIVGVHAAIVQITFLIFHVLNFDHQILQIFNFLTASVI